MNTGARLCSGTVPVPKLWCEHGLSCGVAAADTILLLPVLSWTSSFVVPMALMSRLTQSIHLCFRLPLFLLPGDTISRVFLPTHSWSRLFTWPNHLSLASDKANYIDTLYNTGLILDGCSKKVGRSGLVRSTVRTRTVVRHLSAAGINPPLFIKFYSGTGRTEQQQRLSYFSNNMRKVNILEKCIVLRMGDLGRYVGYTAGTLDRMMTSSVSQNVGPTANELCNAIRNLDSWRKCAI